MRNLIPFLFLIIITYGCSEQRDLRPNIILINIDDMGWRDLGIMGSQYYETPNIDQLAKEGMIFTNGYASAANCAPSRACMLSGKWTTRHGIYTVSNSDRGKSKDRKIIPTKNTTILAKEFKIIPEVLKANGYQTCHAGKWHISKDPLERGIDINIGGNHSGSPGSYYPPYKNVPLEPSENNQYLTDLVMEHTLNFVRSAKEPFFLHYTPYAVHTPIQAVDSLLAKYQNKPVWNGQSNVKYATMVENLDRNIGLLIKTLKAEKLYENSFIIFTTDNGGLFGITQQKPLRAGKGSYYEGGIRVPFFFVWPGMIDAESKSDIPVTNLDLFPTILEILNIDSEVELDGVNILPILKKQPDTLNRSLYWHFPIYLQAYNPSFNENRDSLFRTRPGSVVRKGNWKLHHYFEDNEYELYDLGQDIEEQTNLMEQQPKKAKEMIALLDAWRKKVKAPIPKELNPDYENPKKDQKH